MENSSVVFIVLIILQVAVMAVLYAFFRRLSKPEADKPQDALMLLQNQITQISKTLDTKLGESNKEMQQQVRLQFSESQKLIQDITKQLTEVKETNKQVFGITEQLQNLEKVLKNQKQRGNLGEAGLELILSNILPPTAYKLQYEFKNGEKVDAIIITKEGFIPIDAKFSLDNYNRIINEKDEGRKAELEKEFKNDLKKRIDETAKYIRPNEGTLPFAFMFIPAEGIYYDLLINEVGTVKVNTRNLIDYAYKDKNVVIISPTTFAAYLQSILYGFRAFKIEKSAQEIIKRVEDLSKHLQAYDMYMRKLGNNLGTTVNAFNASYKELGKIDKDVLRITGEATGIEAVQIEKPSAGEGE
jgi:DNA recombination protein RmuC